MNPQNKDIILTDITLRDIKAALRQIIRLHCRLSHVAAHTAIFSLYITELKSNRMEEMNRIRTFLGYLPTDGITDLTLDDETNRIHSSLSFASNLLTQVQKEDITVNIITVLNQVLLDELSISKNLTAWPCESFWSVGDDVINNNNNKNNNNNNLHHPSSSIIQKLATALSPDCHNDPTIQCFVQRDKCEANGNAVCHK
jgi:hypothetical protein